MIDQSLASGLGGRDCSRMPRCGGVFLDAVRVHPLAVYGRRRSSVFSHASPRRGRDVYYY